MVRMGYMTLMNILATAQAWKILRRVEKQQPPAITNPRDLYHAIVIPVYQESVDLIR
jgi:hypothetical protein